MPRSGLFDADRAPSAADSRHLRPAGQPRRWAAALGQATRDSRPAPQGRIAAGGQT